MIIARAEAQRESRQSSLQSVQATASDVIEQARGEIDAAIRRLTVETEKAEAELEKTSAVGGESWKAIKSGLEEVISVYDRTWKKISETIANGRQRSDGTQSSIACLPYRRRAFSPPECQFTMCRKRITGTKRVHHA